MYRLLRTYALKGDIGQTERIQSEKMTALFQAIQRGSIRGLQLVLDGKHDKSELFETEAGTTALIEACKFGDKKTGVKMAKMLLRNSARIESRDLRGRNALHWACSKAHTDMIDLFMKSSEMLDMNVKDFNGNSVMYHAVRSGDCNFIGYICRLYIENGGGVETKNNQGITAVDLALKLGHKSCAVSINKATGLTQTLNSTGCEDTNCCTFNRVSYPADGAYKLIKDVGFRDIAKQSIITNEGGVTSATEPLDTFNARRFRKTRFLSLSSDDLTIKERFRLPALSIGEFSLVNMYGRQRSKTDPVQQQEKRKKDKVSRKNGIFNGEIFPSTEESRIPNTCGELLVDFNSIYSAENTHSYRRGFSKPKEKTKIVTFSESVESRQDKEDDAKTEEKAAKNKLTRRVSKMSDTKLNSTFIAKGKERRKSRKSRDDGI